MGFGVNANQQRGIAAELVVYALAALVVALAVGYAVYRYNHALAEATRLSEANKVLAGSVDTLTRANQDQLAENLLQSQRQKDTEKLLLKLQTLKSANDETERKIDATLSAIMRQKPEIQAWADTPVPADIIIRLRLDSSAGGARGKDSAGDAAARAVGK